MREQGRYTGNLTAAKYAVSTKKGTPFFELEFDVFTLDGQSVGQATVNEYDTEKTQERLQPKLKRLGFDGNYDQPGFTNGNEVALSCSHEEQEGFPAKEVWRLGGGAAPPAGDDIKKLAAARWAQQNGTTRPAPPKPPTTTAAGKSAPPPFTPTKAPPAPPLDPNAITTLQGAWDAWNLAYPEGVDQAKWNAAIADVGKANGVVYAKFTGREWDAVASKAIPI